MSLKSLTTHCGNKIGFFRFKKVNGRLLLTNDAGEYSFLTSGQFDSFLSLRLPKYDLSKYQELCEKGFVRKKIDLGLTAQRYAARNAYLGQGASLHILVVTLRCDHRCLYCQVGAARASDSSYDMNTRTAKNVVDRVFESPNPVITIEFQGGEPLLNFPLIQTVIEYALKKNKIAKKKLNFTLVSNFSPMNQKMLEYLIKYNVHMCTSLDGPEKLHNMHRKSFRKNGSYYNTVFWLKKIRDTGKQYSNAWPMAALPTITRYSLPYPRDIVDEYVRLGIGNIHLRPVTPFGKPFSLWKTYSYPAEDFLKFYTQAVDYVIELNLKGKVIVETFASIFLKKILTHTDPCFMDIRSPCGAGIGQLAYNFNGDIYSCDEGRMLSRLGEESFKLGNANTEHYNDFMKKDELKALCIASCLDLVPGCYQCAYKPYCGICPLYNFITNGNIFKKSDFLCKVYAGILDYLFIKLQDKKVETLFSDWVFAR